MQPLSFFSPFLEPLVSEAEPWLMLPDDDDGELWVPALVPPYWPVPVAEDVDEVPVVGFVLWVPDCGLPGVVSWARAANPNARTTAMVKRSCFMVHSSLDSISKSLLNDN